MKWLVVDMLGMMDILNRISVTKKLLFHIPIWRQSNTKEISVFEVVLYCVALSSSYTIASRNRLASSSSKQGFSTCSKRITGGTRG